MLVSMDGTTMSVVLPVARMTMLVRGVMLVRRDDLLGHGPVHGQVCDDQWRSKVQDLTSKSSPAVEDGGVEGPGQRSLTIGRERIGGDALLRGRA